MKKKRAAALLLALVLCLGLLPTTALARGASVNWNVSGYPIGVGEDEEGEDTRVFITFEAGFGLGKFSDGNHYVTLEAIPVPGKDSTWEVQFPTEDPVREGYEFAGWYTDGTYQTPVPEYVSEGNTVLAKWVFRNDIPKLLLDPNGGTCSVEAVELNVKNHTAPTLDTELPVPTRDGYAFQGWYTGNFTRKVAVGDVFSREETIVAKWAKIRTSKTTPSVSAVPSHIEAGAKKVEISLQCLDSGVFLDWRPLERVVAPARDSNLETAVSGLLSGNFSEVGLKLTKIDYDHTGTEKIDDNAYPYEFYPEGICPASALVLTLEGEARTGLLTIQLSGKTFLEAATVGSGEVLDASSADIFNTAQTRIHVGSGSPDGPFTVKFDLSYKKVKESEVPEEQKILKGGMVDLPDGKKITPPASNLEFYAWCMKGEDNKLYPWKDGTPVTADMTLYAGWVKKGTVVKDGQAVPDASAPAETPKPAAPKFSDVPPMSAFADAISWAVEQGITNGKTATTFGPGDPCTRAQIVTFLWRAAESPEPKLTETQYMDVTDPGAYYYKAVQWAAEMDMEYAGTFDPHETCTRASAVYFIWKAFGSPKAAAKSSFADMPEEPANGGQWYWPDLLDAVDWAVGQGVTNGKTATTFAPADPCTRGQIVTFLYRAYQK